MKYNETILKLMQRYPTIMPSELECLNHIFLHYGTGYELVDGEMMQSLSGRPEPMERTVESILGGKSLEECDLGGGVVCFHPCGMDGPVHVSDFCHYSPLWYIVENGEKLNEDWDQGLRTLCHSLLKLKPEEYRGYLQAYYAWHAPARRDYIKYDIRHYRKIQVYAVRYITDGKHDKVWQYNKMAKRNRRHTMKVLRALSEEKNDADQ